MAVFSARHSANNIALTPKINHVATQIGVFMPATFNPHFHNAPTAIIACFWLYTQIHFVIIIISFAIILLSLFVSVLITAQSINLLINVSIRAEIKMLVI